MKTLDSRFTSHLALRAKSLATLWKVTRRDGVIFGFTDHSNAVTYDDGSGSLEYEAEAGFTRTAVSSNAALSVDNLDVESYVTSDKIKTADIRAGLYDRAEVVVYQVIYSEPSVTGVTLRRGTIGEIQLRDFGYIAEVRGLNQAFTITFVESYTPTCRADLGDSRCTINLAPFTDSGTVVGSTSHRDFTATISTARATDFHSFGVVYWLTGDNSGFNMEVKKYTSPNVFELFLSMPFPIAIGDTFDVVAGCDKRRETCISKFNNILNFVGEPDIPGIDQILKTPDIE